MSFDIARGLTIDETTLISTNIPDAPPPVWAAGTTYAADVQVSVMGGTGGTEATVYESLAAANLGNAPATSPAWWRKIATAYSAWLAGPVYPAGAIVTRGRQRWFALVMNSGYPPETSPDQWRAIGPTNKWAPFDDMTGTQAVRARTLSFVIEPKGIVETIALMNLAATHAHVLFEYGGETRELTIPLTSNSGITDAWKYCFEPIQRRKDLIIRKLPMVYKPRITVTLTSPRDVALGHVVVGLPKRLGGVQFGTTLGIDDNSKKTKDPDFGAWTIVERDYTKYGTFRVWIKRGDVDPTFDLLAGYRAKPVLILGSDTYSSSAQFVQLKSWEIEITRPNESLLALRTDGL